MITIFLVFLFIIQIICFYFLALLYTKVTKFNDLEKKQRKLMAEMDDSIGAYLSELKDENERLIEQLTIRVQEPSSQKVTKSNVPASKEGAALKDNEPVTPVNMPRIPVQLAIKSYKAVATGQGHNPDETTIAPTAVDARTQAIRLYDAGQSIEEIAKKLGKGRTEIELILKFR